MAGRGAAPKPRRGRGIGPIYDAMRERKMAEKVREEGGEPERPDPPADLDVAGATLWLAMHDDLDDAYELDARETEILHRACRLADLAADLKADVAEHGRWIEGSTGRQRLNPAIAEQRQAENACAALLSKVELGPEPISTGSLNSRQRNRLRDVSAGA
jgi:phage terminase small subunit